MGDGVPESREVWEHGQREFDWFDTKLDRFVTILMIIGSVLLVALACAMW